MPPDNSWQRGLPCPRSCLPRVCHAATRCGELVAATRCPTAQHASIDSRCSSRLRPCSHPAPCNHPARSGARRGARQQARSFARHTGSTQHLEHPSTATLDFKRLNFRKSINSVSTSTGTSRVTVSTVCREWLLWPPRRNGAASAGWGLKLAATSGGCGLPPYRARRVCRAVLFVEQGRSGAG